MHIGQHVYVKYKGIEYYSEIIDYEFPYYIVRLSSGLELSYYEDELEEV